jgi:hypothetical protein
MESFICVWHSSTEQKSPRKVLRHRADIPCRCGGLGEVRIEHRESAAGEPAWIAFSGRLDGQRKEEYLGDEDVFSRLAPCLARVRAIQRSLSRVTSISAEAKRSRCKLAGPGRALCFGNARARGQARWNTRRRGFFGRDSGQVVAPGSMTGRYRRRSLARCAP